LVLAQQGHLSEAAAQQVRGAMSPSSLGWRRAMTSVPMPKPSAWMVAASAKQTSFAGMVETIPENAIWMAK
jgi:hypothetical protein